MSDHANDVPANEGHPAPAYNALHFPPGIYPPLGFNPAQFPGGNLQPPSPTPSPPPNPPAHQPQNPPLVIQYNQPRVMPSRYDRNAPKFDGNPRLLKRFFEDIEVLARHCRISPEEQIAQTLRYLDGNDYDTWRMRPSAAGNDWDNFKREITDMYPGADDNSRYSVTDLELFVKRHASSPMSDQSQFGAYYREFLTRSGWLRTRGMISQRERNKLFINGFHIDFRNQLRTQLRLQEPLHPLDEPWNIAFVEQAARFLLDGMNGGSVLALPPPVVSPPAPPQYNPPVPLPIVNSSLRPTFDMSSIEQILMSDAFINRLASRIPSSVPLQQSYPSNSNASRTLWPCGMCSSTEHLFRNCPAVDDYMRRGLCKRDSTNRICVPDGTQITPQLAPGRNMRERIDNWHKAHPRASSVQANIVEVSYPSITNEIISPAVTSMSYSDNPSSQDEEEIRRLGVVALAAMKRQEEIKKRAGNVSKGKGPPGQNNASSNSLPPIQLSPPAKPVASPLPQPQFRFASPIEDPKVVQNVIQRSLDGTIILTQRELYAIAPDIRKYVKEQVTTHRIPAGPTVNASVLEDANLQAQTMPLSTIYNHPSSPSGQLIVANQIETLRTIPLELDGKFTVDAILDEGSQIIGIRQDIWE
jgi:hypothetical protein